MHNRSKRNGRKSLQDLPLWLLLTSVVVCIGSMTSPLRAEDISPSHPLVQYTGRWDHSVANAPWCAWQGSSIRLTFEGTKLHVLLDGAQRADYVRVIVDGVAEETKRKVAANETTVLLIEDLPAGRHTFELVKETYAGKGHMTLKGIQLPDGRIVKSESSEPKLRLAFYGDSNLAGTSLESEKNQGDAPRNGCHYTFAGITARALDAEYQNISVGGAGIADRQNSVVSFYNRMDFYRETPKVDFSKFPIDICVLNIGANDIGRKSEEQIRRDYQALLKALRNAHPAAHLVVMNGYGWARNEPANYTHSVVENYSRITGDKRISCLVFPWLFNEWHGCEYDHAGMAKCLLIHLEKLDPRWKAQKQLDVMDGFGRNGDVANGSFEAVAPFGGFGWRYFRDGAKRIRDPDESPDGDWFLRLPPGKQAHQPSPAIPSMNYAYRMQLRGDEPGSSVSVRFEFRDQKWRNEIPGSSKEIDLRVTEDWKDYRFDVTAPSAAVPSDRSRDPWQVIVRLISQSGTIDVDQIRRTQQP